MFRKALDIGGRMVGKSLYTSPSRGFYITSRTFDLNQPVSADELPRPAGLCSMMRLPVQETTKGLDACFIGVPQDIGVGYKNGARMGPRYIRVESMALKALNAATGAAPFESLQVADVGDVRLNQYDLVAACEDIRRHFSKIECIPITLGGDHSITYPILQAMKEKHGPVGLIQLDAHTDTADNVAGNRITHATSFRRALEDGCIIPEKTFQIGIRGTWYSMETLQWGNDQGFNVYKAEDVCHKPIPPLMEHVRNVIGDTPVYLTFDIDVLDPSFAPGTGFAEIGGLTTRQALEAIRGCKGLNIVGCDLVEVSPPLDNQSNMTSMTAAQLLFEMLCVLPGVRYHTV